MTQTIDASLQELINLGLIPEALLSGMQNNQQLKITTDQEDMVRKTDLSSIKHKEIKVGKDKSIHVYDGIFNYAEISGIYNALSHGTFILDNANRPDVQSMQDRKLVYRITPDLLDKLHFLMAL